MSVPFLRLIKADVGVTVANGSLILDLKLPFDIGGLIRTYVESRFISYFKNNPYISVVKNGGNLSLTVNNVSVKSVQCNSGYFLVIFTIIP